MILTNEFKRFAFLPQSLQPPNICLEYCLHLLSPGFYCSNIEDILKEKGEQVRKGLAVDIDSEATVDEKL